jgi:hypothetical protein
VRVRRAFKLLTITWLVAGGALTRAAVPAIDAAGCLPSAALKGAEIVVLDQHGGRGWPSSFELAESRHPTRVVVVAGDDTDKPLALVVSAYEPTVWDVSALKPSRLRAVVAYGAYPTAVIGNAPNTLVRFGPLSSSMKWQGSTGCAPINLAFSGTGQAGMVPDEVNEVFGVNPTRYFGAFAPAYFNVDRAMPAMIRPSAFIDQTPSLPAGVILRPLKSERRVTVGRAWSRPVQTSLRWDPAGELITDQPALAVTNNVSRAMATPNVRQRMIVPVDRGRDELALLVGLLSVGAAGAFALAWYRNGSTRLRWRVNSSVGSQPKPESDASALSFSIEILIGVCKEPTSRMAFEQLRDEMKFVRRTALDADLAEEAALTMERDAQRLMERTLRALNSSTDPMPVERSSHEAVRRLIAHLRYLREEQRRRDTDELGTTQGFLRARYPAPEDPLALR